MDDMDLGLGYRIILYAIFSLFYLGIVALNFFLLNVVQQKVEHFIYKKKNNIIKKAASWSLSALIVFFIIIYPSFFLLPAGVYTSPANSIFWQPYRFFIHD